uniref:Odorant-binding protein 15 n=1 Tax=Dastarcus helophoroides TaxID=1169899 RepID=A0A1I9HZQ3_9CUCU|nr:odorant-binding protein 15 [Dastarcus helophoroides]
MKALLLIYVYLACTGLSKAAMTEAQYKAGAKLIRKTCISKSKVDAGKVEALRKGEWPEEKALMCYLYCVLASYKVVTPENTLDVENGVKALNAQAPESIRDAAIISTKNCKDSAKTTSDKCKAAYEISSCVYNDNPANYFLP